MNKFGYILIFCALVVIVPNICTGEEKRYNIPTENSPAIGPKNAPVTIIEFLDYQ